MLILFLAGVAFFQSFYDSAKLLGRGLLPLFEFIEHFPPAFHGLAGGLEEGIESAPVVVIVLEDIAGHELPALGAADKNRLGATGIANDYILECFRMAGEAGLGADFHDRVGVT